MSFALVAPGTDTLGVACDDKHLIVKWSGGEVFFSYAQKGHAISAHFSANRSSVRLIREAIEDFCAWAFEQYPWCRMMMAAIQKPSVVRLVEKCGFVFLTDAVTELGEPCNVYVRLRHG